MTRLALGEVAVRLHLYSSATEELGDAIRPPWPRWMERLYATERWGDEDIDPEAQETTMGAALSAVAERLHHRLRIAAWAVTAMEALGWKPRCDGDTMVLTRMLPAPLALNELEDAGVLGPLTKLCELDAAGLPRVFERSVP